MRSSEDENQNQIAMAFLACRDAMARSILRMCIRQEHVDDILVLSMAATTQNNRSLGANQMKMNQRKSSMLVGITTFVAAILTHANASAQAEPPTQGDKVALEEIIVTAERRQSNVQEVPTTRLISSLTNRGQALPDSRSAA
jgi:hypothetical protein